MIGFTSKASKLSSKNLQSNRLAVKRLLRYPVSSPATGIPVTGVPVVRRQVTIFQDAGSQFTCKASTFVLIKQVTEYLTCSSDYQLLTLHVLDGCVASLVVQKYNF